MQRLDKVLVSQGVGTRSEVQRLIRRGDLAVDGIPVRDPAQKVDETAVTLTVKGVALGYRKHLYIMMNKPAGWLCVSRDPKRETVLDLLPDEWRRPGLFPAGRLDKDTVGFTLITDDGGFAHRMLAPRKHVVKTYHAVIDSPLLPGEVEAFAAGLRLDEETLCLPAKCQLLQSGENPLMEICIAEGKYHQIKRMFGHFGHKVLWLKRVSIGGLALDPALAEGESRLLTELEIAAIWQ